MAFPSTIRIGQHQIARIEYDQIQPGDLICTYEALTTRPDLLAINTLQKYATFFHRPELNKMFHFEVIAGKYPRLGAYRIAHADGSTKKVGLQNDNFKDHHPGQAFIVFRANDKAIQDEMIAVALKTAEPNNDHTCRILKLDSWYHRLGHIFRFFKFENFWNKATPTTLKNVALMTAEYEASGRLYRFDGKGAKEMSCVEYVANVANIATARVLTHSADRLERVTAVFNKLKELNKAPHAAGFLLKFSNGDATPASMVDFILKNPSQFHTVGYVGFISDPIHGPTLDLEGDPIPTTLSKISEAISSEELQPDPIVAAQIMITLGMLNQSWEIYPKVAADPVKVQTLFAALYARLGRGNQKIDISVCRKFAEKWTRQSNDVLDEKQMDQQIVPPKINPLSFEDRRSIFLLEKEFLKSSRMERTEKTLKISLNALAIQKIECEKIQSTAQRVLNAGQSFWNTIVLAPLSFGCSLVGNALKRSAASKQKAIEKIGYELLVVHEKSRKNGCITLETNLPKDTRPWIHYSINGGETWDQEPFQAKGPVWNSYIHIPEKSDIHYKLFIGPENVDDLDPVGKALAWQQPERTTYIPSHRMQPMKDGRTSYLMIDTCHNPTWNVKIGSFQRSPEVFIYQKECDQWAPLLDHPLTVEEYEANYAKLETQLEPIIANNPDPNDPVASHLKLFVERKLKLKVDPKQIQFMDGGLGKGLSGDRIYKVLDQNENPILIVKVFMKSRGKFSREFYTLMNHEGLNLKHMDIPTVLAIGSSRSENNPIYFLATNFVQGSSFYEMLTKLMTQKLGSAEREKSLKTLTHIYGKLGKAIAEIHCSRKSQPHFMHPAFTNLLRVFSKNAFKKLKEHLEPAFLAKLEQFFEKRFRTQSQKQFTLGYIHGDLNPGNVIYDSDTDRLAVLDWPDGSLSVGKNGTPTGIPFYDLIQIKNELVMRKSQGLTDGEGAQLYNAFLQQYTSHGGKLESAETMEFFSAVDLIGSLKWFLDKKERFIPDQLITARGVYNQKLEQLKALLNLDFN